jgi:hypothetical protein
MTSTNTKQVKKRIKSTSKVQSKVQKLTKDVDATKLLEHPSVLGFTWFLFYVGILHTKHLVTFGFPLKDNGTLYIAFHIRSITKLGGHLFRHLWSKGDVDLLTMFDKFKKPPTRSSTSKSKSFNALVFPNVLAAFKSHVVSIPHERLKDTLRHLALDIAWTPSLIKKELLILKESFVLRLAKTFANTYSTIHLGKMAAEDMYKIMCFAKRGALMTHPYRKWTSVDEEDTKDQGYVVIAHSEACKEFMEHKALVEYFQSELFQLTSSGGTYKPGFHHVEFGNRLVPCYDIPSFATMYNQGQPMKGKWQEVILRGSEKESMLSTKPRPVENRRRKGRKNPPPLDNLDPDEWRFVQTNVPQVTECTSIHNDHEGSEQEEVNDVDDVDRKFDDLGSNRMDELEFEVPIV